ncbi:MAG: hypothetical protein CMF38_05885 [Legionellaceae bacterium]|nr:hypothetical protein [Legionellaceae bacterium]|tara:strand:+ start:481 stop:648 length:168 start_codon:yes stop_codon:yes gene_type:complete
MSELYLEEEFNEEVFHEHKMNLDFSNHHDLDARRRLENLLDDLDLQKELDDFADY